MGKKLIIKIVAGLVSLAVVAIMAVACTVTPSGETPENVYAIESDDGNASLEIPQEAMPEDVDISDISVTNVSADEGVIIYDLKPDGLTFNEDIVFKATFDNPECAIPIVYQTTENDGIEMINNIEVDIDVTANKSTVSAPLSHFCDVFTDTGSRFFAGEVKASDTPVGQNINSRAVITKTDGFLNSYNENYLDRLVPDSVYISGKIWGGDRLSPDHEIPDRPPRTLFEGNTYTIPGSDYVCEVGGLTTIGYSVRVEFKHQIWHRNGPTDDWQLYIDDQYVYHSWAYFHALFRCTEVTPPETTPPVEETITTDESQALGEILAQDDIIISINLEDSENHIISPTNHEISPPNHETSPTNHETPPSDEDVAEYLKELIISVAVTSGGLFPITEVTAEANGEKVLDSGPISTDKFEGTVKTIAGSEETVDIKVTAKNEAGQEVTKEETFTAPVIGEVIVSIALAAESYGHDSVCDGSLLIVSYSVNVRELEGITVTNVVLKVNGEVWDDSGSLSTKDYHNSVQRDELDCGKTFTAEVIATTSDGVTHSNQDSITTPAGPE